MRELASGYIDVLESLVIAAARSDNSQTMFRNEREFADFVQKALHQAGHDVQREVPVGSRHRLDMLAVADGVRKGVEVKFTAPGWPVYPGGEARYHAAVFNMGEKTAVNVEVSMVPAGAFSAPQKSKARAQRATIDGGDKWEVDLACKVKNSTRPGKHPLMLTVRAANA